MKSKFDYIFNGYFFEKKFQYIFTIVFTSKCYKFSLFIIVQLLIWLIYYTKSAINMEYPLFTQIYENQLTISKIIWILNIIQIVVIWNIFLYFYHSVYKYKYLKSSDVILISYAEKLYKNPLFFGLMLYFIDSNNFYNKIDNSFWLLISAFYYFTILHLIYFYQNFDCEIKEIKEFNTKKDKKLISKIKTVTYTIIISNIIFTVLIGIPLIIFKNPYSSTLIGKGFYTIIKSLELLITRILDIRFNQKSSYVREQIFVNKLKISSFIEIGLMYIIFFQIFYIPTSGEASLLVNTCFILICFFHFYFGLIYYRNYENRKEDFRNLDRTLSKKVSLNEKCAICHQKLENSRILKCNHCFHLICIWNRVRSGLKTCPICNKIIIIPKISYWIYYPQADEGNEFVYSFKLFDFLWLRWTPTINITISRGRLN